MKKFSFRLKRILDVRAVQEKVKLTKLGQERLRLEDERHKLELFHSEEDSQMEQARQEQSRPFRTWSQQANTRYLKRLDRVIQFQKNSVVAQEEQVTKARNQYVDAHRETESLEKIQEKKLIEWKSDVLRDEGKLLDEHGTRRHSTGDTE